jgi:hypothetical protein
MTDILLRDVDPLLFERLRRIGQARGWTITDTLLHVLVHGLQAFEGGAAPVFADAEAHALEAAIAALEQVPDDAGFALIGRAIAPPLPSPAEPDQSVTSQPAVGASSADEGEASAGTPSVDAGFRLESPAYR